ncbi:hypothetical protein MFIFM68171_02917 [Madurella fahalii]|uniref:Uncharacterized protein n=1 Tax=Madurella fahalii TaxID=1157608 RepID=A0ABQ0G4N6_9PEZI
MKKRAEEKSLAVDDEELEGKFEVDIASRARQWATKYASLNLQYGDESGRRRSVVELEGEFRKISAGGDVVSLCRRYDADIIVDALLVRFVTDHILRKPFLLFELEAGPAFAGLMVRWYKERLSADPESAHRWRYEELKWLAGSLMPPNQAQKRCSPSDMPTILIEDHNHFADLAQMFVDGPAGKLLQSEASLPLALRSLAILFQKAAQVGLLMWRQPCDVQIRGFDQLRGLRFPTDGREAKTHASQLSKPGWQPHANAVVDLVVQPSFVARQGKL